MDQSIQSPRIYSFEKIPEISGSLKNIYRSLLTYLGRCSDERLSVRDPEPRVR